MYHGVLHESLFNSVLYAVQVANSRPDLAAVLKQAIAAHSTSQKISVFVAGEASSQSPYDIAAHANMQHTHTVAFGLDANARPHGNFGAKHALLQQTTDP